MLGMGMMPMYKPEYYDFLYEKSSCNRILITARTLFASLGYDNTSTALIARTAGTSESQLITSGDTSKPASRGHLKTGQLSASRTSIVLPHR